MVRRRDPSYLLLFFPHLPLLRYTYVTPAGHGIAHALHICHTRWAWHCTYVTPAGHGFAHTLHICHTRWAWHCTYVTPAGHGFAHTLHICHTRCVWHRKRGTNMNINCSWAVLERRRRFTTYRAPPSTPTSKVP
jgi:hypothetical protein